MLVVAELFNTAVNDFDANKYNLMYVIIDLIDMVHLHCPSSSLCNVECSAWYSIAIGFGIDVNEP